MVSYLIFGLTTAFVLFWRWQDARITMKAQKDGIGKETTGLVATRGKFSFWKATIAILVLEVAFWIAFVMIEHTVENVVIASIWKAITGIVSMVAYYSNKKDIRNRKPESIPGGVI